MTLPLVDTTRPTVSHGQLLASSRSLFTLVWYPTVRQGPLPLIVFAHGFQVGVTPYQRICALWASAGYIVAAPEFPLTDQAIAGAHLDENDKGNQPADVSFVITSMLALSAGPALSALHGRVLPAEIAVAGHSDGADTALATGYLSAERDLRLRAVMAEGADALPTAPTAAPRHSDIPLLLIHGTADSIVPFASSESVAAQLNTPGWFLQLIGADHLQPIAGPSRWTPILDEATTDFFNIELKGAAPSTLVSAVASDPNAHLADLKH
jgi:predicted dienelactone hydrolase